jgi:valyl-tRNA synthetase
VLTPEARMAETVPDRFQGLDRFEARKRVVAELEAEGLLVKAEPHTHAIGRCYRCDTVVEPRLSDQWFVRMKRLAAPALAAYRNGTLSFVPERWGPVYDQWMAGIRDWCISRQIWWGHRIPVWYCDACGTMTASVTDLYECKGCHGPLRQDDDVLDTWFSSQLVPFSSLGWPDKTRDLARFYPGHVLVTGPDIIFFWVARMVMSGLDCMGSLPFTTVYLTGIVRDTKHQKMSKSRGNGIDPLAVIERFGADALRYAVLSGAAVGTDVILDPNDLETSFGPGRNFANKLWNAGRFILSNLDGPVRPLAGSYPDVVRKEELTLADRWIIARCDAAVRETTQAYERYRLNEAVGAAYRFLWSDLADWYIEQVKPRLYGDQPGGDVARAVLARVFDVSLRLLHPAMPFITETLWQRLPGHAEGASIESGPWPVADARAVDGPALAEFGVVQEIVGAVRSIRAEYAVQPGQAVRVSIADASKAARRAMTAEEGTIRRLAKVSALSTSGDGHAHGAAHAVLQDGTTVTVPLGDLIDVDRECARLGTELERLTQLIASQETKLANPQFTSRAPEAIVAKEREKLGSWREQAETLRRKRAQLGCAG